MADYIPAGDSDAIANGRVRSRIRGGESRRIELNTGGHYAAEKCAHGV